jgi:hypothetical protein
MDYTTQDSVLSFFMALIYTTLALAIVSDAVANEGIFSQVIQLDSYIVGEQVTCSNAFVELIEYSTYLE